MLPTTTPQSNTVVELAPAPTSFHFDEQKITMAETSEKKELFLFQWLHSLEKDLSKSSRVLFNGYIISYV